MRATNDHALGRVIGDAVVGAVGGVLLEPSQQLGRKPDVVGKDDDLAVSGQLSYAIRNLADTSIIQAVDGVIEDQGRRSQPQRCLRQEVGEANDLLLTLRQDQGRMLGHGYGLAPRRLTLLAWELKANLRSAKSTALLLESLGEVCIEQLLARMWQRSLATRALEGYGGSVDLHWPTIWHLQRIQTRLRDDYSAQADP